ncbi:hypothetical protein KSS87_011001, partial [Heliosperma pusillum]
SGREQFTSNPRSGREQFTSNPRSWREQFTSNPRSGREQFTSNPRSGHELFTPRPRDYRGGMLGSEKERETSDLQSTSQVELTSNPTSSSLAFSRTFAAAAAAVTVTANAVMRPLFQLLVLLFFVTIIEASSSSSSSLYSIGSRSLLRKLDDGGNGGELIDVVVELNDSNFKDVLKEIPAPIALVEFFAHWCPACRNYKPHYEKVARIFNGPNASHPGLIFMARVDCASKINTKLCDRFSVDRYPMLLWGKPNNFTSITKWDGKDGEIVSIKNGHTAERLLEWINKKMNSSYGFEDKKYEHEHLQSKALDLEQLIVSNMHAKCKITQAIYDVEEATALAFDIILRHKMIKQGTKASLVKFLQLMVAHHPSRRCRKGSAEILVNFDDLYPLKFESEIQERGLSENATSILGTIHICGKDIPREYWMFCRGSTNDTRGFRMDVDRDKDGGQMVVKWGNSKCRAMWGARSREGSCGLWILLHSLSVRIEDGESQVAFTTTCDFIHNFFICEECRQHFFDMCSRVSIPFNKTQDFALWLWDAHNTVNKRLLKEEGTLGTADPKYPKTIWPPEQLCPACYLSSPTKDAADHINWNKDEVFKFLVRYYGIMLPSLYKNKGLLREEEPQHLHSEELAATSNPVVVPIGAAAAIAVASCAFGALACVWRSKQKSRKEETKEPSIWGRCLDHVFFFFILHGNKCCVFDHRQAKEELELKPRDKMQELELKPRDKFIEHMFLRQLELGMRFSGLEVYL